MDLNLHYGQLLGLTANWRVVDVDLALGDQRVEVVPERKQRAAESLILTLSQKQRDGVLAVAMDMWPAFMNAAEKHLPEATIVHDKFHVVKHLGEAVDSVRKAENRTLNQQGDTTLKGAKYLSLEKP